MTSPFELTARQFWPTTFFQRVWADHPREAPAILGHLLAIRDRAAEAIASGVAKSAKPARGLFESDFDLFETDHPGLLRLRRFLEASVADAVARLHANQPTAAAIRVRLADAWFHVTNDGGFHDAHVHGECSWCGIYYLQAGESGPNPAGGAPNGGNRFYSPLTRGGGYKDLGSRYLDFNHIDPPIRDGLLILFPSYLLHSALPYSGATDRVVIAFNAQVLPKEGPAA
jgi:uncharacterized protein (TIGR02466 family)